MRTNEESRPVCGKRRIVTYIVSSLVVLGIVALLLVTYADVVRANLILNAMRGAAVDRDYERLDRLVNKLISLGPRATDVAVGRLKRSPLAGKETGSLLTYFRKLGPCAGPFLEKGYQDAPGDVARFNVLWALEIATGDPQVIPRYHELLFSLEDVWVRGGACDKLRNIHGAGGPYFDSLERVTGWRYDRKQLDPLFGKWWKDHKEYIKWTGWFFEIRGPEKAKNE